MLTRSSKYLACVCTALLFSIQVLFAAGSIITVNYVDNGTAQGCDAQPPEIQDASVPYVSYTKFSFNGGAIETSENYYAYNNSGDQIFVSEINPMGVCTDEFDIVPTWNFEIVDNVITPNLSNNHLGSGYACFPLKQDGGSNVRTLIFDLYPNTANIVQQDNVYIAFKEFTNPSGGTFHGIAANTTVVNILMTGTTTQSVQFLLNADGQSFQNSVRGNWTGTLITTGIENGASYGFMFNYNAKVPVGTMVKVGIFANRTSEFGGGQERVTFNFTVEGIPFLQKIVSANTQDGADQLGRLKPVLYSWAAAGKGDINGDGFEDVVVSDPYYKYSNSSFDSRRSGRVYVYFGGVDKIINERITPDLIINNFSTANASDAAREFGFNVKAGDINGDGYSDIIVGQPSYGKDQTNTNINKGRILVYYGGPKLADGYSMIDAATPSVIVNNDTGTGGQGIGSADLLGAKFDVGDINNDGCADLLAKVSNNIYLISGSNIKAKMRNAYLDKKPLIVEARDSTIIERILGCIFDSDVKVVGSFNGDEYNDFVITKPRFDGGNQLYYSTVEVYLGKEDIGAIFSPVTTLKDNSASNDYFGYSVAGADINGDGYTDIIAGKKTSGTDSGKVLIFLGKPDLPNPDYAYNDITDSPGVICINDPMPQLYSTNEDKSQFGLSVAGIGNIDLDNDGCEDFIVGAPFYGDSDIGAVYVFLGAKFADNIVGQDNLRQYVLTGKGAYSHYGMTVYNIGDFDGNGYPNILVSAPGFNSNADFTGYPSEEGLIAVDNHYVDIFANAYAVDRKLPILMAYRSAPVNNNVGWDANNTVNIVLADRGKSGLDFNTLQIKLIRNGLDNGEYVLSSKQAPANNGRIGLSPYFNLVSLWASENVSNGQILPNTNQWDLSPYGTRIATQNVDGYPLYVYQKNAKFIGVSFKPTTNYDLLKNADDYYYEIRVKDRGNEYMTEFAGPEREYVLTLNFSTMQERYSDIGTTNYGFNSGVTNKPYQCIGDLDGDGIADFAYANPNKANGGEVYIYWGTSALNFNKKPDLVLTNSDSVTGFGKIIKTLKMDGIDDRDDLIIGYDKGFYIITGVDCSHYELRASTNYVINQGNFNKIVLPNLGNPIAFQSLKNKSYKNEILAVAYNNTIETYYYDGANQIVSRNSNIPISPNVVMAGGYIMDSTTQNLILGFPGHNDNKGRVDIYRLTGGVLNPTAISKIYNDTLDNAQFGFALAAGYFDTELNVTGDPKIGIGYEDLAIGAPFATSFGPEAGLVLIIRGSNTLPASFTLNNFGTVSYYVLRPESIYDRFGYSLASTKYMSSPQHYALNWGSSDYLYYYDDYDDLVVGAPGYDMSMSWGNNWGQGKVYVYRGDSDFKTLPSTGFVISQGYSKLGASVGSGGDLLNVNNQIIVAGTDTDTRIFSIINNNIPDTIPPHIDLTLPMDHQYEVPVTTSITINVSDMSGISDSDLNIRRKMSGTLVDLVANGQVVNTYLNNGRKYFKLNKNLLTSDGRSVQYVLSLDQGAYWNESEVVELEITVGDARLVWESATKRKLAPLFTKTSTGFVAKYKENSAGLPKDFKGEDISNSYFGESLCYVGDVNGDGLGDFMVGEYGNNEKGFNAGKAYLYLGDPDINKFLQPAAEITFGYGPDSQSSARFGWKVAPAGDMNGDGYDDVAIVAANSSITGAEIFILYGNPDPRTNVNDLDRVRLENGPLSYPWDSVYLSRHATCIKAAQDGDGLGNSIYGGGDINGDGYDDLAIGAPLYDEGGVRDVGRSYIIFGSKDMQDRNSRYVAGDYQTVANAGPIRLDQVAWDLTNTTTNFTNMVAGYLKNPDLAPTPSAAFNNRFGSCILEDININGDTVSVTKDLNGLIITRNVPLSEILISAVGYSQSRGKVYIFTKELDGAGWKLGLVNNTLVGDQPGDEFGFALANLGDISADTNMGNKVGPIGQDFVVGAPGNNGSVPKFPKYEVGAAYVYLSTPNADGTMGFSVNRAMISYGQNAGDRFGYAVSNVGNVNNDLYGNNDIAVGAPFYNVITGNTVIQNGGRVYIFSTDLTNKGTDLAPNYQVVLSSYPEFIAQGDLDTRFFGAALAYLGDTDGDFIPEYLVGAPGCATTVNSIYTGNVGRVKLYTNPDTTPPDVYDPMSYIRPIPGDTATVLRDFVGRETEGVRVTVSVDSPISFRIHDDRSVKLDSVMIEVDPQGKNDTRRYIFSPPKTGERYYTYVNRKTSDFFLYLKDSVYFSTTYNVRVYATDMRGNSLAYYYNTYPLPGFGGTVSSRIPDYTVNPNWQDSRNKQYFEFKFFTAPSKGEGPVIEVAMDNDANAGNTPLGYQGTLAYMTMTISDNKLLSAPFSSFIVEVSPNQLATNNRSEFEFGITKNLNEASRLKAISNYPITLYDFPDGQRDGKYYITVRAKDSDNNISAQTKMFIRDIATPNIIPTFPLADTIGNPDDCSINFKVVDNGSGVNILDTNYNIDYSRFIVRISTRNTNIITVPSANLQVAYNDGRVDKDKVLALFGADTDWRDLVLDPEPRDNRLVFKADLQNNSKFLLLTEIMQTSLLELISDASTNTAPEGYANFIPEVRFSINNYKFNYKERVTVSVTVSDNAGHGVVYSYDYQVSPDYRPPFTKAGQMPLLWESPYTTGNLSISLNAYDDIGVAGVLFEINELSGEISGNSGIVTNNSLDSGINQLFVPVTQNISNGSLDVVTKNYAGLFRLFVKKSSGAARLEDGTRRILISFLDAEGNKSKTVSADIIVDAISDNGGPVMPIVMASAPQTMPPLFDEMPRYINTRNVDVWLYATDLIITPNIPSGSAVNINPMVLGYVLGVEGYAGRADAASNINIYRLKEFNIESMMILDTRTKRTYLHVPNVDIGGSGEGSIKLIVNFADNDAGINLDKIPAGGTSTNRSLLFDNSLISPWTPTRNDGDIYSASHNVNDLTDAMLDYLPTWNKVHFSDEPFVITFNYDFTPPSVDRLIARGGSTIGGDRVDYKSSSYSRDFDHIQFSLWYRDEWTAPDPGVAPIPYPITDLYYQIICITGNTNMLVVDAKGRNTFVHESKTFETLGNYQAYDGTLLDKENMVYITPSDNNETLDSDGRITNNQLELSVVGSTPGTTASMIIATNGFVTDNLNADDFLVANKQNWTHLDLSPYGLMNNDFDCEIPVKLKSDAIGYYLRVCIKDRAGNYSRILTSNIVELDLTNPEQPVFNYKPKIKVNKNKFDIDFSDSKSGLAYVGFKMDATGATDYNSIVYDGRSGVTPDLIKYVTVNNQPVGDYIQEFTENWAMPQYIWDALPEGLQSKIYFKVDDAVALPYQTLEGQEFSFIKDITPLTVTPDFANALKFGTRNYTTLESATLNIGSVETHIVGMTDLPLDTFVTDNGNEHLFFKDFSFENAGDASIKESRYLQLVSTSDTLVTMSIKLLEHYPSSDNNILGGSINGKHYNGNYALVLDFDIPQISSPVTYSWPGLVVTVDISSLVTVNGTTNFTVGVLMDTDYVNTNNCTNGAGYPLGGVNNLAQKDGGFALVLQANSKTAVSDGRINKYSSALRAGQKWSLITSNIQIEPGTDTLTINIMHLRIDSTKTNPIPFVFDRLYQSMQGVVLLDSLMIIPGIQVPDLNSSVNGSEYAVSYNVKQGTNEFYYVCYDELANPVTGSLEIIRDNTPPTWDALVFLTTPSTTVVGLYTAAYQLPTQKLLNGANGIPVSIKTSAEGVNYVNAFDRVSNKGYLAGFFQALDTETPVSVYGYEGYEVLAGGDIKIGGATVNAENKDIDTPLHPVNIDAQFDLGKGKSYYLRARAVNRLNYSSDWMTSNVLTIDIDAPTISYQVQPSIIVTINPGGAPEVTQNTGWYFDNIAVTLNARDMFMPNENNPDYLIPGGVGVQFIYLVTNNGVIRQYDVSTMPSANIFVTFNLSMEGPNTFRAWAVDQFGYKSKEISVTHNLNIDRSAPQAGFEFEPGILSEPDLSVIRWQNKPVGFNINFSDVNGVGTRELHWLIDGVAESPFQLNFRPIGQTATLNVVPRDSGTSIDVTIREGFKIGHFDKALITSNALVTTLKAKGIIWETPADPSNYYWNQNWTDPLFLNDEELERALKDQGIHNIDQLVTIWRFNTVGRSIHYQTINSNRFNFSTDGYHQLDLYTIDKLNYRSATMNTKYICIDQGRPDIIVNLGGSFQTEWSLQPVTISMEAMDMFRDDVLVTDDYYDYSYVPGALQGLKVKRPGSGVKEVVITMNGTRRLPTLSFDGPEGRFGFTLNKYNFAPNNIDNSAFIITTNGINMFSYQVADNVGNASTLTSWDSPMGSGDGDPLKKFWNDTLISYVYDGDNGIIRGIKIDTQPPYEPYLQIVPISYTDTLPTGEGYPLFTNQQDIYVRFGAKDDGIGVKYAYITAVENITSASYGIINTQFPDPDNYLSVDAWQDIAKLNDAVYKDPDNKEQGFLTYANYRKIRLGELQGTRNINIQLSDDFGLDYAVSKASVEQRSSTFNATDQVNTINMVPLEAYAANKYSYRTDASGTYFYYGGRFDVPTDNYGAGNRSTSEGSNLNLSGGYTFKEVYYGNGISLNVYSWDESMPARFEHRGATVNAVCTLNNLNVIVYDNFVTKSIYEPVIVEMAADTINGVMQDFINRPSVTLKYRHDEGNDGQSVPELSGITDIMFAGDIQSVKVSGNNNTTYNINTWVPYKYRANVTNDYIVTLKPPLQDSVITVNIIGVRDRAGNFVTVNNMHTISFFYDRPMPWDNLNNRIIYLNGDGDGLLKGAGQPGLLLTNAVTFNVQLDMFGADRYQFAEYLYGPNTINVVASGDYKELPEIAGTSKKSLHCGLSPINREDGHKTVYVTLYDRGNGPSSNLTVAYDYISDTTHPTINIYGLEDKLTKFYENYVTFSIYYSDNNPSADYVAGLKTIEYKLNDGPFKTVDYSKYIINSISINNLDIHDSGLNNTLVCRATDKLGNQTMVTVNGIRLNNNPPSLGTGVEFGAGQGNVHDNKIYINTATPNIKFVAYGNTDAKLEISGDVILSTEVNPFVSNVLNFTGDDGTKNITVTMRDSFTSAGGPSATKVYTVYLDRQKPSLITNNQVITGNINYVPDDMFITGSVVDLPNPDYASGAEAYLYLNNDVITVFDTEHLNDNDWSAKVRQLIEKSNRREGVFILRFFAKDRANNYSEGYAQVTFNLTSRYVKGGIQTNINSLDINDVSKDDNRLKIADGKLRGVKYVESLNKTITDFKAYDVSGNEIRSIQSASGDVKVVIQYDALAADGTDPDNFKIYYLNEATAEWELVPGEQKVDKVNRTVEAIITHFSIYKIFATVPLATDLKNVRIYPNPYHSGDDNKYNGEDGVPGYDKVTIENITQTAKARIYTISGELVNTLELQNGQSIILWSMDNMNGQSVASGVYVVLVTDQDNNRFVGRITVIR